MKLAAVSLLNSAVHRWISDMANNIKDQVMQKIKSVTFNLFSIQLNELAGVISCSELVVFVRYIHLSTFTEEFLICSLLETTT